VIDAEIRVFQHNQQIAGIPHGMPAALSGDSGYFGIRLSSAADDHICWGADHIRSLDADPVFRYVKI
jgi:hypothetical protein